MTSKGIMNHNENLGVKQINTPQDSSLSNESHKPIRKESGLKFDPMTYKFRVMYIVLLVVMTCIVVATRDRMPQDESYHKLADERRLVTWIPNTLDVISNLAFLLVSFHGLRATMNAGRDRIEYVHEKLNYLLFFGSVGLVGVGSTYYHLQPSTWRLFWDRLPMSIAFASMFSILISEKIDRKSGGFLLGPLLVIAFLSVVHWIYTELNYHGDLRMYITTQFGITLVAPFIHFLFDSRYTHSYFFLLCMTFNLAAKMCEMMDKRIFDFTLNTVSGHTLKHFLSSIAVECVVLMLMNRTKKFKKKIE